MRGGIYRHLADCLDADRLSALVTVIAGPGHGRQLLLAPPTGGGLPRVREGSLGTPELDEVAAVHASALLASFRSERKTLPADGGEVDLFFEIHPPRPKLVIVGAVHVAAALVTFAKELGFKTIVVDPRTAFATPERFAHADELRTDWPDEALAAIGLNENTYLALLSHDLKLDVPALRIALPSPARYVGALGSKKTHAKRLAALAEAGLTGEVVERIHNPIGLDLGGRRAEEIAVAILAEMIAVRHGKPTR